MVQLVLDDIRVELGQLVVHFSRAAVVLDVEVAIGQEGKSGAISRRELELVRQDGNDLDRAGVRRRGRCLHRGISGLG